MVLRIQDGVGMIVRYAGNKTCPMPFRGPITRRLYVLIPGRDLEVEEADAPFVLGGRLPVIQVGISPPSATMPVTEVVKEWVDTGPAIAETGATLQAPGTYGVVYVAYGERARMRCVRSIETLRAWYPGIPVVAISDEEIAGADMVYQPDVEASARCYKTRALSFVDWDYILYLDADTEIVGPLQGGFTALAAGWDLAAGIDYRRTLAEIDHVALDEAKATMEFVGTEYVLQYNTGVLFIRRSEATLDFYNRWYEEWQEWGRQDQAAFLRALHGGDVKVWTLAETWNTQERENARHVWHRHTLARREGAP